MWVVVLIRRKVNVKNPVEAIVTGFVEQIGAMAYADDCNADPESPYQAFAIFTRCVHCSK